MPPAAQPKSSAVPNREAVWQRYREVRAESERLAAPLATEDYVVQAMPDVSPPKWHLAHITWFFEHFIAAPYARGFVPFHPQYGYLFNSYYETIGPFFPRLARGLLSRPTVEEVYRYRAHVDRVIGDVIDTVGERELGRGRAPDRARAAPRAAAPGAAPHRPQVQLRVQPAASPRTGRGPNDRRRRRARSAGSVSTPASG